jgi:predicted molibdopterin-dependent oxidoreductase YjgC
MSTQGRPILGEKESSVQRLASGIRRGDTIELLVDGETVHAHAGETVAAALLASGRRTLRRTPKSGAPRGMFCGMGVCFDCVVTINGESRVRACMTPVQDGMRIDTGAGVGPGTR